MVNDQLKYGASTQYVYIGPFMSTIDGSIQTGLSLTNDDIWLIKAGSAATTSVSGGSATHVGGGLYRVTLNATDVDTIGSLVMLVEKSGSMPLRQDVTVLPASVHDSFNTATDNIVAKLTATYAAATVAASQTSVDKILGLTGRFRKITATTYVGGQMTACTIKTFANLADYNAETNPIATYTISATYTGVELLTYGSVES